MYQKPMKTYLRNPPKQPKTYLRRSVTASSIIPSAAIFSDSESDENVDNKDGPLDDTFDRLRKTAKPVKPAVDPQQGNSAVFYSSSSSSDTSELEVIPIPQSRGRAPPKRGKKRKTTASVPKVNGNPQKPPTNKGLRRNRRGNDDDGVADSDREMEKRIRKTSSLTSSLESLGKSQNEDKENEVRDQDEEKKTQSSREMIRRTSPRTFPTRTTNGLSSRALSEDQSSETDAAFPQVHLDSSNLQQENSSVIEITGRSLDDSSIERLDSTEPIRKTVPAVIKTHLNSPSTPVRNNRLEELSLKRKSVQGYGKSPLSSPTSPINDCWVSLHRLNLRDIIREKSSDNNNSSLDSTTEPVSSLPENGELMNGIHRESLQVDDPGTSHPLENGEALEKSEIPSSERLSQSVEELLQSRSLFSTDDSTSTNETGENHLEKDQPQSPVMEKNRGGKDGRTGSPKLVLNKCSVVLELHETLGKSKNSAINQSLWSSTPLMSRIRQKGAGLHLSPIPMSPSGSNTRKNQEEENGEKEVEAQLRQRPVPLSPPKIVRTRITDDSLKQIIERQLFSSTQNTEESMDRRTRVELSDPEESQGEPPSRRSPRKARGDPVDTISTIEISSRLSADENDVKAEGRTVDTSSSGSMSPLMFEDSNDEENQDSCDVERLNSASSSRLCPDPPGEETELQEVGTDISSHLFSITGEESQVQEVEADASSLLSSGPSTQAPGDNGKRGKTMSGAESSDAASNEEMEEDKEVVDALKERQLTMAKIQLPNVLLTRLSDGVNITDRRSRYRTRESRLAVISENDNKRMSVVSEEEEKTSTEGTEATQKKALGNDGDTSGGMKSVFLKPGKSWARSLSILNNIQKGGDIEALAAGKGKNWRQSVISVLNMQSQGGLQSCRSSNDNDGAQVRASRASRSSTENSLRKWSMNRDNSQATSPKRFIRRVSIRVVPDRRSNLVNKVQESSFHEAYGISTSSDRKTLAPTAVRKSSYALRNSGSDLRVPQPLTIARNIVLSRCNQTDCCSFSLIYSDEYLNDCRKIGEGVYGEVFLFDDGRAKSVIKIIPIEGKELVNGEPQKKFEEILSEIVIAKELHDLRTNEIHRTDGFVEVKNIRCLKGKYPEKLVNLWEAYDEEKKSDNDCPSMFKEDQLYIALELGDGGKDLEGFVFQNASEAFSSFIQTALTLAVAEKSLDFEHRDLHWGNILISRTNEKEINYRLNGDDIKFPCQGVRVAIIDFTLSRMSYEGCCIFNDLALDPSLFTAVGEYQFEIYRLMREQVENNWQAFEPVTNVLWLHYTLGKLLTAVRYKRKGTKIHQSYMTRLQALKNVILDYNSAFDFVTSCDSVREVLKIN
ncbi:uncharacterized protein LOC135167889 isoform X2 [Diachasmimorpha longicaudata]